MRSSWAAVAASCVVLAGCSDGTGPQPIAGSLTLDFCSSAAPIWFAYQNEGGDWTRVEGNIDNTFTFDVTERVAIAMTTDFGDEVLTDIFYATRSELLPLADKACIETFGAKTLNGAVADVLAGEQAIITMGEAEAIVTPPPSTFVLDGVPDGPRDVIAHREVNTIEGLVPDRVIRRVENRTNNATLPTFDFSESTSDAVAVSLASISGLIAGEENALDVFFLTVLGTNHYLYAAPFFSTNSQAIYGIPTGLTQQGDLHEIRLNAQPSSGETYRELRRWYREPSPQSLALGPTLNEPEIAPLGSSPYLRLRASLASQPEYDSFATAYFTQGQEGDLRSVFVTHTAGFHGGTPSTWRLDIPDVTEAGGYPSFAALTSGDGTTWFVEAFDGSLADIIGQTPTANATVRWAGRTNSVFALRAQVDAHGRRAARRPALLDHRGFRR